MPYNGYRLVEVAEHKTSLELQILKLNKMINRKKIGFFANVVLAVFILSGCVKEAKESVQNGNFTVEFLFEENGCKMYRFNDGGRYVYWSDCQGKVQSDYSTTQSGKTRVTHHVEAITSE